MVLEHRNVAYLENILTERGINHSKLFRKDVLVGTVVASECGLINPVSFTYDDPSLLATPTVYLRRDIHNRLAFTTRREMPERADLLRLLHSQGWRHQREVFIAVILYLNQHGNRKRFIEGMSVLHGSPAYDKLFMDLNKLLRRSVIPFSYRLRFNYMHLTTAPDMAPVLGRLQTFAPFGRLPTELRLMVIKICMFSRIVPTAIYKSNLKMLAQPPAILAVNGEFRTQALKKYYYEPIEVDYTFTVKTNFFHPENDILLLNHRTALYQLELDAYFIATYIPIELRTQVENVAIGHDFHPLRNQVPNSTNSTNSQAPPKVITPTSFPKAKRAIYVMTLATDPLYFEPHEYRFQEVKPGPVPLALTNNYGYMGPEERQEAFDTFGPSHHLMEKPVCDKLIQFANESVKEQFGEGVEAEAVVAKGYKPSFPA